MRVFAAALLAVLLATATMAQSPGLTSVSKDIEILSSRFYEGQSSAQINATDYDGRRRQIPDPYNDGPPNNYKATIRIANKGTKEVKAVECSVVFVDPSNKEFGARKFYRKQRMAPGDEATLIGYVLPYRRAGTLTLRAVITRVEYADGSVWRRS